jgi:hypothetical protein
MALIFPTSSFHSQKFPAALLVVLGKSTIYVPSRRQKLGFKDSSSPDSNRPPSPEEEAEAHG